MLFIAPFCLSTALLAVSLMGWHRHLKNGDE
jgi:hypothetical protein